MLLLSRDAAVGGGTLTPVRPCLRPCLRLRLRLRVYVPIALFRRSRHKHLYDDENDLDAFATWMRLPQVQGQFQKRLKNSHPRVRM